MDDRLPLAEAVLIRGGRVAAVGSDHDVRAAATSACHFEDLAGRHVIPGIVDGHCHLELTATHLAYAVSCHLATHPSIVAITAAVAARAGETPPGEWVIGRSDFGLPLYVDERRAIERADLDAAVPNHPCVVFSGLHLCTLNTPALRVCGLLDGSAILPRGAAVDVASGRAKEIWDWLPLPTFGRERIAAAIRDIGRERWTSRGVTTIAELPFTLDGIAAVQDLRRRGELPVRLGLWLQVPRFGMPETAAGAGFETGFGDEWLQLGGIKLFVDGIGCDIWGNPELDIKWTQTELDAVVLSAHRRRLQLWMHVAPTVEAAEMALTAVERAQELVPRDDHRHRIEHIGDLPPRPALLERIAAAGVIPVTTPQFTYSYGDLAPDEAATPLRSLHALGFRPPGNSDATGTQVEALNPWHSIWCALAHVSRSGVPIAPDEAIDLSAALRMFTRDAALACHMDDRGMLAPGLLGDLVVLGADPFQAAPADLPDLPVDMTVIGGEPITGTR